MKFEKLSEDKIRITLSLKDLEEKDIDFHVFMANTLESQDILLDMLDQAKKEVGFDVKNSNLKIEALAMADTNFIFTVTKVTTEKEKIKAPKKKFTVKRKSLMPSSSQAIYAFSSFDDFCNFVQFLNTCQLLQQTSSIAEEISLYTYRDEYYLLLNQIHTEVVHKLRFYASITEFAKYITNSKVFVSKLKECGNLIMQNNALEIGFKHFIA